MRTGLIITGMVAFAGGLMTGLLLTPKNGKENRKWIEDKSQKFLEESEKRIDRVSKGIRNTVKENVPDLYSATETLHFSDIEDDDF